jgi:hypothetical protein
MGSDSCMNFHKYRANEHVSKQPPCTSSTFPLTQRSARADSRYYVLHMICGAGSHECVLLMAGNVTAAPRWLMYLLQRSVCFHGRIFSPVPGTDKVAALDLIYCNVNRTDTLQSDLVRSAGGGITLQCAQLTNNARTKHGGTVVSGTRVDCTWCAQSRAATTRCLPTAAARNAPLPLHGVNLRSAGDKIHGNPFEQFRRLNVQSAVNRGFMELFTGNDMLSVDVTYFKIK